MESRATEDGRSRASEVEAADSVHLERDVVGPRLSVRRRPLRGAEPRAYPPTSCSKLVALKEPTSATFTRTLIKHGFVPGGVAGHVSEPVSAWPPLNPGSGYVITCGKHADTEQRSTLCAFPA